MSETSVKWNHLFHFFTLSYPVSTRHRFDIHTTSITLKRRRTDVKTASCGYWVLYTVKDENSFYCRKKNKKVSNTSLCFCQDAFNVSRSDWRVSDLLFISCSHSSLPSCNADLISCSFWPLCWANHSVCARATDLSTST